MTKFLKLFKLDELTSPSKRGKMYKGTTRTIGVSEEIKEEFSQIAHLNEIGERTLLRKLMSDLPEDLEKSKDFVPVNDLKKLRAVADCHSMSVADLIDYWLDHAIEQSDHKKLKRWKKDK